MKQLLYSHGEPAGIGVDLILHLSKSKFLEKINAPFVCIADSKLLESRAKILGLKLKFIELQQLEKALQNKAGIVQFIKIADCKDPSPGKLNPNNAKYVIKNLNFGIKEASKNMKIGLVTGPIQKSNIMDGGFAGFQGHTEWIQKKTKSSNVVMLLSSKKIKVALATTHIPLTEVTKNIQKDIQNKTILVTGAAGSIGSEIVRQLLNLQPKKVILLDQAESALYDLNQDLIRKNKSKKLINKFPIKSIVFNQEKLNDSDDAGIIKITKNIKLPMKPRVFDRFIKNIFPK